jgi:hypothetical protein
MAAAAGLDAEGPLPDADADPDPDPHAAAAAARWLAQPAPGDLMADAAPAPAPARRSVQRAFSATLCRGCGGQGTRLVACRGGGASYEYRCGRCAGSRAPWGAEAGAGAAAQCL